MTLFLVAAALAVVLTLFLLLRPFLWKPRVSTTTHQQLNAAIYRDQFAELERDRAEGALGEEDYQLAYAELQRRMLEDSRQDDTVAAAAPAPKKTMLALALLVPLTALLLYALLGNPAGLNPPAPERRFSVDEIERMVAGLAAKLENEPDNFKGWAMLARSYKAMGRLEEAEKAYGRAMKLVETDAQLLADYAEVLALNAGGKLDGKPMQYVAKALKLDPDAPQALVLAGTAAFERKDFAKAADYWDRLLKQLPPESEDARSLGESIAEARKRAAAK